MKAISSLSLGVLNVGRVADLKMVPNRVIYGVIFVLIVLFLFQALFSMWDDSPTFDELINPAVGYAELFTGDFGLVNDHPPFYRIVTAMPLLAFQPNIPLDHESWQKRQKGMRERYQFAQEFFYGVNSEADRFIFWSRIPVVLLSLLLGLLVFQWAKELYGPLAGLFALFLYSFEPNIIAHSRLATNDLILTLFIFSTIYQVWRYCVSRSFRALILSGVLLSFALISKFSAIMLFPMLFLLIFLVSTGSQKKMGRNSSEAVWTWVSTGFICALKTIFFISIIAVGVVLVFYGAQWRLFILGVYKAVAHYQGEHWAFLMGNYSVNGWWYYFPIAFLIKTPIPLLVYIFVACLFLSFRKEKATYFLLIPIGIIVSAALLSRLNIGIRHILPVYPFLIVLASSITTIEFSRPRFFFACFGGLGLWYLLSTLSIFPSYLAYFNDFVGPKRGYEMLVDSNLDWGQDLKRLKIFMDQKGIKQVYLHYFGTASPCYYGIKFVHLPPWVHLTSHIGERCLQEQDVMRADFIAVSASGLQLFPPVFRQTFEWLKDYKPVAQIGYSIFVYDIQGDAFAHTNLGLTYLKYGLLEEALNEFRLVVELAPQEAIAHANLGFTYARLSHFDKAKEAFQKALRLDPENRAAKEGLKEFTLKSRGG